jgi:hypothetical protein
MLSLLPFLTSKNCCFPCGSDSREFSKFFNRSEKVDPLSSIFFYFHGIVRSAGRFFFAAVNTVTRGAFALPCLSDIDGLQKIADPKRKALQRLIVATLSFTQFFSTVLMCHVYIILYFCYDPLLTENVKGQFEEN